MTTVNKAWVKVGLTGGATTDLDSISYTLLSNNDVARVPYNGFEYYYIYSTASTAAENVPLVIKPDDAGGTGRWILNLPYGIRNKNYLLNPRFNLNQPTYNYSSSIVPGNYYFDGWFLDSGGTTQSVAFESGGGIVPGVYGMSQLYGQRQYSGATQVGGIVQGETLTVSGLLTTAGQIDVYAGYGVRYFSGITTNLIGSLTPTTQSIQFTANFGATATNYLAITIKGAAGVGIKYLKVERGSVATTFTEPIFEDELIRAQKYYIKSYDYATAPGAINNAGAVSFRNTTGGANATHANIPCKVQKMHFSPSVTIYSPNTGATANIYDTTATADVGVTGVVDLGQNGFSTLVTSATIASNNLGRFHYVMDARP